MPWRLSALSLQNGVYQNLPLQDQVRANAKVPKGPLRLRSPEFSWRDRDFVQRIFFDPNACMTHGHSSPFLGKNEVHAWMIRTG